ncbi:TetR/AcrR family transcriptional regulator [Conexibacter stalactiti]|uniref:TetR/AcrR family transcriptional regulator n=1 Tax=Conexibacter stalactiti TaxID=1940611 RepID=A0ABU4HIH5_9ACTN|nr:TetR/AcrR family transcriptional regulator [Conexibacter stalactiti]MDW5593103.1 TetR/AcrR family transcriptional regulator [Conexibacter stalactiti]MEC5033744.1 TetR/AcrR family transcriptional regulator [Conexibacter stalactiti]
MRPSSKVQLLEAAVHVTARDGIAGVTLEAVASEAGLTKAGLLYHFRSKEALLEAVQHHLLERLEGQLLDALGRPLEEATPQEAAAAYLSMISSEMPRRADLIFVLESMAHPYLARPWDELMERWIPQPRSARSVAVDLFLTRMAVDGIWLFDATSGTPLSPSVRQALIERIAGVAAPRQP